MIPGRYVNTKFGPIETDPYSSYTSIFTNSSASSFRRYSDFDSYVEEKLSHYWRSPNRLRAKRKIDQFTAAAVPPGPPPCDLKIASESIPPPPCPALLPRKTAARERRHERQTTCPRARRKLRTWER